MAELITPWSCDVGHSIALHARAFDTRGYRSREPFTFAWYRRDPRNQAQQDFATRKQRGV